MTRSDCEARLRVRRVGDPACLRSPVQTLTGSAPEERRRLPRQGHHPQSIGRSSVPTFFGRTDRPFKHPPRKSIGIPPWPSIVSPSLWAACGRSPSTRGSPTLWRASLRLTSVSLASRSPICRPIARMTTATLLRRWSACGRKSPRHRGSSSSRQSTIDPYREC